MRCRFKATVTPIVPLVALFCLLSACRSSPKHRVLQGHVLGKSGTTQQITVSHGNIPGFMPAMTMPYLVKDPQGFQQVQPGDLITANVVGDMDDCWLEHLNIMDKTGRASVSTLAPHALLSGEPVPDIPLTNQDGKALHLAEFKGKAVLITFIYTRCPFQICPLISSNFAAIHRELAKTPQDYAKTHLISISLDPEYDTPPIMRKYGLSYLANDPTGFEQWDFVSTTSGDLRKIATAFGLEYFEYKDNREAHSEDTVLLATDGTVTENWPGNGWDTSDMVSALRQAAAAKK